jgi:hypothetical protein
MCYRVPPDFLGHHIPPLDSILPILDHPGLFIALHAHVLVSHTTYLWPHPNGTYLTPKGP